jgi:hypothetical protein
VEVWGNGGGLGERYVGERSFCGIPDSRLSESQSYIHSCNKNLLVEAWLGLLYL